MIIVWAIGFILCLIMGGLAVVSLKNDPYSNLALVFPVLSGLSVVPILNIIIAIIMFAMWVEKK